MLFRSHLTEDRTEMLLEWIKTVTGGLVNYHPFDDEASDENDSDYNPREIYVSDLKIIHSGNVHGGIGLDRPYWTNELVMWGKKYNKGVVITPENGGIIAFIEFRLPKNGGRLLGLAGWAEQVRAIHRGKMRFRLFGDGELLYGCELNGKECQAVDLDLGQCKVLRIESDDGGDGNEGDHMAFADLRIVY